MAVVVVKDVLVFLCLAMNLEFANMVRHCLNMLLNAEVAPITWSSVVLWRHQCVVQNVTLFVSERDLAWLL